MARFEHLNKERNEQKREGGGTRRGGGGRKVKKGRKTRFMYDAVSHLFVLYESNYFLWKFSLLLLFFSFRSFLSSFDWTHINCFKRSAIFHFCLNFMRIFRENRAIVAKWHSYGFLSETSTYEHCSHLFIYSEKYSKIRKVKRANEQKLVTDRQNCVLVKALQKWDGDECLTPPTFVCESSLLSCARTHFFLVLCSFIYLCKLLCR